MIDFRSNSTVMRSMMTSIPATAVVNVSAMAIASLHPVAMPAIPAGFPDAAVVVASAVEIVRLVITCRQRIIVAHAHSHARPGTRRAHNAGTETHHGGGKNRKHINKRTFHNSKQGV
jgi:hypothetical protein